MKLQAFALACAILAGNASASVLIDFEGLANGSTPGEAYADLGVHFTGGTVQYNQLGAYLYGPFTVRFETPMNGFTFGADGLTIDSNSTVCFFSNPECEPQYLGSTSWVPYNVNHKAETWYPGKVWETHWGFSDIASVRFVTEAFDNLRFDPPAPINDGTVPEPGSVALLGLGAMSLLAARRRRTATSQHA